MPHNHDKHHHQAVAEYQGNININIIIPNLIIAFVLNTTNIITRR